MPQLSTLRHLSRYGNCLLLLFITLILGCGGGGEDAATTAPSPQWIQVNTISPSSSSASLAGTAWVSNTYYASHCSGLACFMDTTRTDDYPGVDITCVNLTSGVVGNASSYYGPGTSWVHQWYAGVPVVAGSNTIQISAYDPGGKGGSVTVEVVAPPALTVLATTPSSGAAGVLVNSSIAAQLSSAIDPGGDYLQVNGPNGAVAGTRAANEATVTFTPGGYLAYNTTYTVTLPASLRALSGASLTADYSWSFTTMAFPVFGVLVTYPAAGEINVPRNPTVSATCSGAIDPMSVSSASFFLRSPTGAPWGYTYAVYGATVSVADSNLLEANTTYTATLTAAFRDKNGNPLSFDYVWSFTTGN